MGKPIGGAFGRHPGHDDMSLCRGKASACLREAASAKAGANLIIGDHGRSCTWRILSPGLAGSLQRQIPYIGHMTKVFNHIRQSSYVALRGGPLS
jgi:hypothetical protein